MPAQTLRSLRVPRAAAKTAARTLAIHKEFPLQEPVGGQAVATALQAGRVVPEVAIRMHRFFALQERLYEAEVQQGHTVRDSARVRSWALYGGDSGRIWAAKTYQRLVNEGYTEPEDHLAALLQAPVTEVYSAFSLGAWKFEYDLTPQKAARFVEEYLLAQGLPLDLSKAFGGSAQAVGNALYRRYHTPDPMKQAVAALQVEDLDYKLAAALDLEDIRKSLGSQVLQESLPLSTWTMQPTAAAKKVWAPFVAYCILAVEKPSLLKELNKDSKKPPKQTDKPSTYTAYHDAINIYRTYFHPEGAKWKKPMGKDNKFLLLEEEVFEFMWKAYYGKKLYAKPTQKMLGKMRRWLATLKMAGSLFHVFNADWKKGNWSHILDNIPPDADIRPAFETFVGENPIPNEGLKLQQTLSHKQTLQKVEKYLDAAFPMAAPEAAGKQHKVGTTHTGQSAKAVGTPAGVYSVLSAQDWKHDKVLLGVWSIKGEPQNVAVLVDQETGEMSWEFDPSLGSSISKEKRKVVKAHEKLAGTFYTKMTIPAVPQAPQDQTLSAQETHDFQDDIDWKWWMYVTGMGSDSLPKALAFKDLKEVPFSSTETAMVASSMNMPLGVWGAIKAPVAGASESRVIGAFEGKGGKVYIAVRSNDGVTAAILPDSHWAAALETGKLVVAYPYGSTKPKAPAANLGTGLGKGDKEPTSSASGTGNLTPEELALVQAAGWPWYDQAASNLVHVSLANTNPGVRFKDKWNITLQDGHKVLDTVYQSEDELLFAFRWKGDATHKGKTFIVYRPDGLNKPSATPLAVVHDSHALEAWEPYQLNWKDLPHLPAFKIDQLKASNASTTQYSGQLKEVPMWQTEFGEAWKAKYGKIAAEHMNLENTENGTVLTVGFAYLQGGGVWLFYGKADVPMYAWMVRPDEGAAKSVKDGTWAPVGTSSVEDENALTDEQWALLKSASNDWSIYGSAKSDFAKARLADTILGKRFKSKWGIVLTDDTPVKDPNNPEKPDILKFAFLAKKSSKPAIPYVLFWNGTQEKYEFSQDDDGWVWKPVDSMLPDQDADKDSGPAEKASAVNHALVTMQQKSGYWWCYKWEGGASLHAVNPRTGESTTWYAPVPQTIVLPPEVPATEDGLQKVVKAMYDGVFTPSAGAPIGTPFELSDASYWYWGHESSTNRHIFGRWDTASGDYRPLLAEYDSVDFLAIMKSQVKSSYEPTEPKQEGGNEPDGADPEQGILIPCGTEAAIKFMLAKAWTPATKPEHKLFLWHLGEVRQYGSNKTRTIIGYCFDQAGDPAYVIVTEKGNVNYKYCANAHKSYGGVLSMSQPVLDALLPKPGDEAKQKFPRLNYKLGKTAKAVAQAQGITYVMAPKDAAYLVGTRLEYKFTNAICLLLGWREGDKDPEAIIQWEEDQGSVKYGVVTKPELKDEFLLIYKNHSLVEPHNIVFGRKAGSEKVVFSTASLTLPSPDAEGWEEPAPVLQPSMGVPKGKHVSAGVVAFTDEGELFSTTKIALDMGEGVLLRHPLNEFGGYKLALPKGQVDKGESIEVAAVREVYEETGCTVKPLAFLGDYYTGSSVTRLFVGVVTGGDPTKPHPGAEETDAVTLKSTDTFDKWKQELIPDGSGSDWQVKAIQDAILWRAGKGKVTEVPVDVAAHYSQVTKDGDVPLPPGATKSDGFKPTIPATVAEADPWKALYFKCPYPVTSAMVNAIKQKLDTLKVIPQQFWAAKDNKEGVKYNEEFTGPHGDPLMAAGYLTVHASDDNLHHFMFGVSASGAVHAVPSGPNGADYHVSGSYTGLGLVQDAFYTHPDDVVQAVIQDFYEMDKGATVKVGDLKNWCKEVKVPAWSVITKDLASDILSMFVPGACTQAKHDLIIACLKARMKQTHKQPKPAAPVSTTAPPTDTTGVKDSGWKPPKAQPVIQATAALAVDSYVFQNAALNPQPMLFSETGDKMSGGSKPNKILNGPGGRWFFKYAPGEDFRPHIDAAAYKVLAAVKEKNIPVGVMEFNGQLGSIQPVAEGAKAPPGDPSVLSDENKTELLAQHAYDMFVGDHDGHSGNWLMVDGQLRAIDKGQAFKFLLMGKNESLDPSWHAPGNFGSGYAKGLLLAWGKGDAEIPQTAFAAMRGVIQKVEALDRAYFANVLQPVFEKLGSDDKTRKKVLDGLAKRAKTYEKDWTVVLKKLRSDFQWPVATKQKVKPMKALKSDPKEHDFDQEEAQTIADAVQAGWQGKTLKLDKDIFENQEVMVKRVYYQEKPGVSIPATLIHFRLSKPAGVRIGSKLFSKADVAEGDTFGGGPQRLKADMKINAWPQIFTAIKSVNYHLSSQKDTAINEGSVKAALNLRPALEEMAQATQNPDGKYALTDEPNEAVFAMASQYLQYLGTIQYYWEHKEEEVGSHTPHFYEFVWEDPPEDPDLENETSAAPPYKIYLRKQGATAPTTSSQGQEVIVVNTNFAVMNSGTQSQFVIEDPVRKARLFIMPPAGVEGTKAGVKGHQGHGWGIMPGEPTPQVVAHLVKLLEVTTGEKVKKATPKDRQVLYWSAQAAALQGGGRFTPTADGTAEKEAAYAAAMAKYREGKDDEALAALLKFVAGKMGVPVEKLHEQPGFDLDGEYTRGAGFNRHTRLGWTVEKLQKALGPNTVVAHHLAESMEVFITQRAIYNGALIANNLKNYYGVTKMGASPSSDYGTGGSQGLFTCLRKAPGTQTHTMYFHISLMLRLDAYQVGTADTYGDVNKERRTQPQYWSVGSGAVGASSSGQVSIRHDIDLREYLVRANCGSPSAKEKCIQTVKDLGWQFKHGTPESIFTTY